MPPRNLHRACARWLLLLLGACLLNVVVAWSLSYFALPVREEPLIIDDRTAWEWRSAGVSEWLVFDKPYSMPPMFGPKDGPITRDMRLRDLVARSSLHGVTSTQLQVTGGWPRPAFTGVIDLNEWPARSTARMPRLDGGTSAAGLMRAVGGKHIFRALPWRPIWPGFVVDTLLWLALLAAPGGLRAWSRRRRSRCVACAYPIGSSSTCTECGAPLAPVRALSLRRMLAHGALLLLAGAIFNLVLAMAIRCAGSTRVESTMRVGSSVTVDECRGFGLTERFAFEGSAMQLQAVVVDQRSSDPRSTAQALLLRSVERFGRTCRPHAQSAEDLEEAEERAASGHYPPCTFHAQLGWPCPAFQAWEQSDGFLMHSPTVVEVISFGAGKFAPVPEARVVEVASLRRSLRWQPFWSGAIVNSVMWAMLLAALLRATLPLRVRFRPGSRVLTAVGRGLGAWRWWLILLLACIMNLLTAWGLTYYGLPARHGVYSIDHASVSEWRAPGVSEWSVESPMFRTAEAGTVVWELPDDASRPTRSDRVRGLTARKQSRGTDLLVLAGWPCAAFTGAARERWSQGVRPITELDTVLECTRTVDQQPLRRLLPWRPVWPGFAINTLLWAVLLGHRLWIPKVWAIVRRWRGRCGACGYPIGGRGFCTECGAAVRSSGWVRLRSGGLMPK